MGASGRMAVLGLAFTLAACGFEAPPPRRTAPPPTPPAPLSTLAATLAIPASAIVETLNEKTGTVIANIRNEPVDCAVASCALELVATRTGPITGHAADGRLSLSIPLAATAKLSLKSGFFRTGAHSFATGRIDSQTAVSLAEDWRLHADTQGRVELSRARLKLGPVAMSFADLWNRNQQNLSTPLFKIIDRHIASSIEIKPQAERLWLKVQCPIRIGKAPSAWLLLAPQRIRVGALETRDDTVAVSLGVDIRARVVVADEAPDETIDKTLPSPARLASPSDRFAFVVPVFLPYDQAARLVQGRLAAAPFRIRGLRVRFERIAFLPSGEDVIVAARFCVSQPWDPFGWFDSCGEGYLRGRPVFDAATQTIRIVDVRYDIATEDMLLSAMRFLAGRELEKVIESKLVFAVGAGIDKLDDEVRAALAKPQGRGVSVWGEVESFGVPSLTWTADGFLATFPAQGRIHADLHARSLDLGLR